MTHVSFEEYEAAKAEIIGGVHYKEKSTLEGNVIRKTYATEENGTFYEVNDGGRIEFWSDKHPDSRIYDENERADLPEMMPSTIWGVITSSCSLMPWASRCLGSRWSKAMRIFSSTR